MFLTLPLGPQGKFSPADGTIQGGCRQHGVGTAFGSPSRPTARLMGLFAKGQRNHRTAEIPAHPKGAQRGPGVMQVPEREPRGPADPHQPIFHPESPFFLGHSPMGFGTLILAPLDQGDASLWHLLLQRHGDEDTIGTWDAPAACAGMETFLPTIPPGEGNT